MPYMMGGFPDAATSAAVAEAYAEAGADLVELGVPFSDPLADGPVIHAAATAALDAGATFDSVLETASGSPLGVPVVAMGYANMILARGAGAFAAALADAGAAGAIVPDLPPEEGGEVRRGAARRRARAGPAGRADDPRRAPRADLRRRRGLRLRRLRHADHRRARAAPGAARRADRRDQGRLAGAGRGRLRDRDARAGGGGRARAPTA